MFLGVKKWVVQNYIKKNEKELQTLVLGKLTLGPDGRRRHPKGRLTEQETPYLRETGTVNTFVSRSHLIKCILNLSLS